MQPPGPVAAAPYEPPPPPVVVIPPSPGPDYYWSDGYWNWGPTGWIWFGGRWSIGIPRPGLDRSGPSLARLGTRPPVALKGSRGRLRSDENDFLDKGERP